MDYLLLKFISKKEYLEDFLNGKLYMNSLYYFWNEYALEMAKQNKNPEIPVDLSKGEEKGKIPGPGQIDWFEGTVTMEQAKTVSLPEELKDVMVSDMIERSVGMGYCNVLCFYKMDFDFFREERMVRYDLGNMEEFGDYVVIVRDVNELANRIYKAAKKQGFCCSCGPVKYREMKLNGGPVREGHNLILKEEELYPIRPEDGRRDAFDKMSSYAYQREWRAALCRGAKDTKAYTLEVGDLRDIVQWVKQEELKAELDKLILNGQIAPASGNWYGDDRHELRKKLYELGDNQMERFLIIG